MLVTEQRGAGERIMTPVASFLRGIANALAITFALAVIGGLCIGFVPS